MPAFDEHVEPLSPLSPSGRPYIGVYFECCAVYTRVYRQADRMQYDCRCPRCLRAATVKVGPGGTNARIFIAK